MCMRPSHTVFRVPEALFIFLQSFSPSSSDYVNPTNVGCVTAHLVILGIYRALNCVWSPSLQSPLLCCFQRKASGVLPRRREGVEKVKGKIASTFKNRDQSKQQKNKENTQREGTHKNLSFICSGIRKTVH